MMAVLAPTLQMRCNRLNNHSELALLWQYVQQQNSSMTKPSSMKRAMSICWHLVNAELQLAARGFSFGMVSSKWPVALLRSALLLSGQTSQGSLSCRR